MAERFFHAQILTPSGALYDGQAAGVNVPGEKGAFEVLTGHAPIMSTLSPGTVTVKDQNLQVHKFTVTGGFVEVSGNRLTLLAESVIESE